MKAKRWFVIFLFALLCTGCAATEEPLTPLADDVDIEFNVDEAECPETVNEYDRTSHWQPDVNDVVRLFFGDQPVDRKDTPVEAVFYCPVNPNGEQTNVLIISDGKLVDKDHGKIYGNFSYSSVEWIKMNLTTTLSTAWRNPETRYVWDAASDWPAEKSDFVSRSQADAESWIEKLSLPEMKRVHIGYFDAAEQFQFNRMHGDDLYRFDELNIADCLIIEYKPASDAPGKTLFFYTENGLAAIQSFSVGRSEPLAEYAPISLRDALKPVVEKYRGKKDCAIVSAELSYRDDIGAQRLCPVWNIAVRETHAATSESEESVSFLTEVVNAKDGKLYELLFGSGSCPTRLYYDAIHTLTGRDAKK